MRLFVFFLLSCTLAFAGGYEIYEHGARAIGMAGAYTAIAEGPSAVFYNPAGITGNAGLQIGLGTALIKPIGSFTSAQGVKTDQESQLYTPSHLYATYQINHSLKAKCANTNGRVWLLHHFLIYPCLMEGIIDTIK